MRNSPAIITVNGLTRGGTNLIASLLLAQKRFVCGDVGVFELPLLMESIPNLSIGAMIGDTERMELERHLDLFIDKTVQQVLKVLVPSLRQYRDGYRTDAGSYCGISIQGWI